MADPQTPPATEPVVSPSDAGQGYYLLRWVIRITGVLLMLGGTVYLAMMAADVLTGTTSADWLLVIVVTLIALGVGIFILRAGYNMLRSVNAQTIKAFSFLFALIYTFILVHILPPMEVFTGSLALLYLLLFLYFGLSYWLVKSILFRLLLPRK